LNYNQLLKMRITK